MGAEINDRSERIFGMQQASGVFGLELFAKVVRRLKSRQKDNIFI